jgi:tetratricopeptide (TPR) repeat protein
VGTSAILVDRAEEMKQIGAAFELATEGRGSLLLLQGPPGIGKTRLADEAVAQALRLGFLAGKGTAVLEALGLYAPWAEALGSVGLGHLLSEEPPPRLLAIYLMAEAGTVAGRAERPGFSQDGTHLAMMLNNAGEFLRDALGPPGDTGRGDVLRFGVASGSIAVVRHDGFGVLAVFEGQESPLFLRDLRHLAEKLARAGASELKEWDGNKRVAASFEPAMRALLISGKYDGIDIAADGRARKLNLFDNVLLGLRNATRERPICLVLDDVQWAEPSSLALLHYLARSTREDPVVLVAAYRLESSGDSGPLHQALSHLSNERLGANLPVGPLPPHEVGRFAAEFLGGRRAPEDLVALLAKETEGNPLFMVEVLKQLEQEGALKVTEDGKAVRLARPPEHLRIPARVGEAIGRRLSRLKREDRDLLEAAAVCGTRFSGGLLAQALGMPEMEVLRTLNAVAREEGLLRPDGGGWRFEHVMIREVLHEKTSLELRKLYHRKIAEALQLRGGSNEDLGEHFALAGDVRAVPLLQDSAKRAMDRGAPEEAARFLATAVGLCPPETRAQLELLRADALALPGRYDEAIAALARAETAGANKIECAIRRARILRRASRWDEALGVVEAVLPSAGPAEACQLLVIRSTTLRDLGRYAESKAAADGALQLVGPGEDLTRARALAQRGWALLFLLEEATGLEEFQEAMRLFEAHGDRLGIINGLTGVSEILMRRGDFEEAIRQRHRAVEVAEASGDRYNLVWMCDNLGTALVQFGDLEGAGEQFKRGIELAEAWGDRGLQAAPLIELGWVLRESGEAERAIEQLRRGTQAAREVRLTSLLVFGHSEAVHALLALGRLSEAASELVKAQKALDELGPFRHGGDFWRAKGALSAAEGRLDDARAAFAEALRLGEKGDSLTERALTEHEWGAYFGRAGQRDEAVGHLERAAALFDSCGLARRAARVREDLAKLRET